MKIFKLLLLISTIFNLLNAITLAVDPGYNNIDLGTVGLEENFWSNDSNGHIKITVSDKTAGTPAEVYTYIQDYLKDTSKRFMIPAGELRWRIWWASTDGTNYTGIDPSSSGGFSRPVPYRVLADDRVLLINSATTSPVNITLGTIINRIPAVQPQGLYTTRVVITATQ
jgi:hypothetical protein